MATGGQSSVAQTLVAPQSFLSAQHNVATDAELAELPIVESVRFNEEAAVKAKEHTPFESAAEAAKWLPIPDSQRGLVMHIIPTMEELSPGRDAEKLHFSRRRVYRFLMPDRIGAFLEYPQNIHRIWACIAIYMVSRSQSKNHLFRSKERAVEIIATVHRIRLPSVLFEIKRGIDPPTESPLVLCETTVAPNPSAPVPILDDEADEDYQPGSNEIRCTRASKPISTRALTAKSTVTSTPKMTVVATVEKQTSTIAVHSSQPNSVTNKPFQQPHKPSQSPHPFATFYASQRQPKSAPGAGSAAPPPSTAPAATGKQSVTTKPTATVSKAAATVAAAPPTSTTPAAANHALARQPTATKPKDKVSSTSMANPAAPPPSSSSAAPVATAQVITRPQPQATPNPATSASTDPTSGLSIGIRNDFKQMIDRAQELTLHLLEKKLAEHTALITKLITDATESLAQKVKDANTTTSSEITPQLLHQAVNDAVSNLLNTMTTTTPTPTVSPSVAEGLRSIDDAIEHGFAKFQQSVADRLTSLETRLARRTDKEKRAKRRHLRKLAHRAKKKAAERAAAKRRRHMTDMSSDLGSSPGTGSSLCSSDRY